MLEWTQPRSNRAVSFGQQSVFVVHPALTRIWPFVAELQVPLWFSQILDEDPCTSCRSTSPCPHNCRPQLCSPSGSAGICWDRTGLISTILPHPKQCPVGMLRCICWVILTPLCLPRLAWMSWHCLCYFGINFALKCQTLNHAVWTLDHSDASVWLLALGLCVGHSLGEEALLLELVPAKELARKELDGSSQRCWKRLCSELPIDSFLLNDRVLPLSGKGDVCIPAKGKCLGLGVFFWLLFLWLTL